VPKQRTKPLPLPSYICDIKIRKGASSARSTHLMPKKICTTGYAALEEKGL